MSKLEKKKQKLSVNKKTQNIWHEKQFLKKRKRKGRAKKMTSGSKKGALFGRKNV